jgi:hypothetical protein
MTQYGLSLISIFHILMCTSPGFQNIIGAREHFVRRERFLRGITDPGKYVFVATGTLYS